MTRSLAITVGLGILVFSSALAREPAGGSNTGAAASEQGLPSGRERNRDPLATETTPLAIRGEPKGVAVEGIVRGETQGPLSGVIVKLFANGQLIESDKTDSAGGFRIEANPMFGGNNTIVLWFQSPDTGRFLDANVALSLGDTARERKLLPPCTRVTTPVAGGLDLVQTLMSVNETQKILAASRCLESSGS